MQKKVLLQIFLLLIIITISIIFFKFYYNSGIPTKEYVPKTENTGSDKTNIMSNIKYVAADKIGNKYRISSKFAEFDSNQSNLISMSEVEGTIEMNNSKPIVISSDKAVYNKLNHDTNFFENVLVVYDDHQISSHNLDLFFEKNFASISKNIIYKSLNTELRADKIEIDLITKNSKIFMNDKIKKIKIITLN